jgi:hypothetical protein
LSESGTNAVLVATDVFVQLAETTAAALGARDVPILAIVHPLGGIDRGAVEAKALEAIERLAVVMDEPTLPLVAPATERAPAPRGLRVGHTAAGIIEFVRNPPWSDGLPIVPPTEDLVSAMTAASGRAADEIVAVLAPRFGDATVERIAANAVMAGCRPEAMPPLVAAVEAIADPAFNLPGVQATTHPCGVLILVSGPAAARAGVQGGEGCFGPGVPGNQSLGRALRLVLMNIGGAIPGATDRSCQASPAKLAYCVTENLDASPWAPFHVEEGWPAGDSTVTVLAVEGPHNIQDHFSTTPDGILDAVGGALRNVGCNNFAHSVAALRGTIGDEWDPRMVVVFGPEHAKTAAAEGLRKADIRQLLWERATIPWAQVPSEWRVGLNPVAAIPVARKPEEIVILVAGGAGKHSCWMPSMGSTSMVTRPVRVTRPAPG